MSTKENLIRLFETHKGAYVSGEEAARELGVTRAAVWKGVQALRTEGYPIASVPNKGYCLSETADVLSEPGVRKFLRGAARALELEVQPEVDSTNTQVREWANAGAPEGRVLLAGRQTAGRGRYGRAFDSPAETGLYLSLLLRPQGWTPQEATQLTAMAATALCEAIQAMGVDDVGIKWVNDVYVRGRKAGGILTEASFGMESGLLEYAVLGVGIHVYPPKEGFAPELRKIAGPVFERPEGGAKNQLAAEFLNRMMAYYAQRNACVHLASYRKNSLVQGKTVRVLTPAGEREAVVRGIDKRCRLLVTYMDGTEDCLTYGEIRIRMETTE